jgi:hypothetical protein
MSQHLTISKVAEQSGMSVPNIRLSPYLESTA